MSDLYFNIKIDGKAVVNRFGTADDAMNHAKSVFVKDHFIKEADIYRNGDELVATIKNKDYEER